MDDPLGAPAMLDPAPDPTYAARRCRCIDSCENGEYNSTCQLGVNAKCFRKLEIIEGEEVETAGCLISMNDHIDQCNQAAEPDFDAPTDFKCCWDEDLCNDRLQMKLPPVKGTEDPTPDTTMAVALIISFMLAFMVGVFLIAICCVRFKQSEKKRKRQINAERDTYGIKSKKLGDLVAEYSTPGTCSSGSGMPLLVQRTIARQIEIIRELGRGRYGTVMLGKWRDEYVAVKMFNTTDEDSWYRETEIYQTVLLRHENILCFVASDINGTGSWTELYLITDYHENGSLYDYLQRRTSLSVQEALTLARTAASGLAHLHTEIIGTQGKISNQGKPAIAHRDIKSKNILVKKDGACCIADMGLAVRFSSSNVGGKGELDMGDYKTSCRQGTKRYMAPEVLGGTLIKDSFDAFKAADVYSFALVLWEILNCTEADGWDTKYYLPYYDLVGNDPDFEEMRKVVDVDNMRPDVSTAHSEHPILSRYVETMTECWSQRPDSRLPMLRVRKTLSTLQNGPAEHTPPATLDYSQNSLAYISDRSNSSGFPTHSNDFIYDPMNIRMKQAERMDFFDEQEKRPRDLTRQNVLSANLPLIRNGYGDSC